MKLDKEGHLDSIEVAKLKKHIDFFLWGDRFKFKGKWYKFWTVNLSAGFGTAYEEVEMTYGVEFSEEDWAIIVELEEMVDYFISKP